MYVSAVGISIEYPIIYVENPKVNLSMECGSTDYPVDNSIYFPTGVWRRRSYKKQVTSEVAGPNATAKLGILVNPSDSTTYGVVDAVSCIDLTSTFGSQGATITTGAVDSILNAMGGAWESVPLAPTDVEMTITRAADTCKFKVEVKVRGLPVLQYKIYRSTNGTDIPMLKPFQPTQIDVYSTWQYDTCSSYFGGNTQLWYKVTGAML